MGECCFSHAMISSAVIWKSLPFTFSEISINTPVNKCDKSDNSLQKVASYYKGVCEWSCRSQRPRCLRRRSAAARLLRSWVRIPPGAWMFVCCECCVLSGTGLCDELITRPEESYRLWCVVVCDLETSRMRRPWPALGRCVTAKKKIYIYIYIYMWLIHWFWTNPIFK